MTASARTKPALWQMFGSTRAKLSEPLLATHTGGGAVATPSVAESLKFAMQGVEQALQVSLVLHDTAGQAAPLQADTDLGTSTTPLSSAHSALSTAMPGPRDDAHVVTHRTARVTYPVVPRPQGAEHSVHGETCTQVGRSKRRRATKCSTFHITTNAHRSNQPWMPLMKTELTCHGSFRGCKVHPPHLLSASHAHSRPPPPNGTTLHTSTVTDGCKH